MDAQTVPCTRCGIFDVPAPASIKEDPVCAQCLREMMYLAAHAVMGGQRTADVSEIIVSEADPGTSDEEIELAILEAEDVDPSLTPAGYAPDGLGAPKDETDEMDEEHPIKPVPRWPIIKCRKCGGRFKGRLSDRLCHNCR